MSGRGCASCSVSVRRGLGLGVALVSLLHLSTARADDDAGDAIAAWKPGDPAPYGYRVVRKHALTNVAGAILATSYGIPVLVQLAEVFGCSPTGNRLMGGSGHPGCRPDPTSDWSLMVPLVGPFFYFKEAEARDGTVFWPAVFGIGQIAGAAILTYSLVFPKYQLVPLGRAFIAPAPVGGGAGLVAFARF